ILNWLLPFFKQLSNPIVIEGYTDNQPIHTAQYPSNWELSSARAIGIVRYLIAHGVAPSRLSGVGYGQYHPVAPNDTPAHRQLNRRINIVIMREPPITISEIKAPVSSVTAKGIAKALGDSSSGGSK
ncbi:MAG: OmpA family protein, partial [Alicyclobacillus sp.]|nr:OmpA family protein [Alicyclobacillus sp.]